MNKSKKIIGMALSACLCVSMLAGCGSNNKTETSKSNSKTENSETKKTMVIGDTTFNSSNEENSTNPHDAYSGWACIRYGIGETLVKYSDNMEIQPWLAKEWENVDELTWKITLQDNVKFSSGRDMDAEAVKQCLEHLKSLLLHLQQHHKHQINNHVLFLLHLLQKIQQLNHDLLHIQQIQQLFQ